MENAYPQNFQPSIPPKPSHLTRNLIIALIIIGLVIGGSAVGFTLTTSQPAQVFVGAYADYRGQTTIASLTLNMYYRFEIVDMNSTHMKSLYYYKIYTPTQILSEQQNNSWSPKSGSSYEIEGMIFTNKYNDQVYFENLGTRACTIYVYTYPEGSGTSGTMTAFIDNKSQFPLKFGYTLDIQGTTLSMEVPLESTNVSGI